MLRHNLVTVDLDAIRHNYRTLADALPERVAVMPVVKADAYGHGLVEVARAVCAEGARWLAVALAEEGLVLRQSGVEADILVLGAATQRAARAAVEGGLTQTVFTPEQVAWLENAACAAGRDALMHIKLDTGMGRIGLRSPEEADALRAALGRAPHVRATALYMHFAEADEPLADGTPNAFTVEQLSRLHALRSRFDPVLPVHAANSAASLYLSDSFFSMVRQGISLYGYPPVPTSLPFRPALRWEAEIVHVKSIPAGTPVGYGCTFVAPRDMRVATVAVGYGDGYHRALSGRGEILVRGRRARITGRVCMDQTMIDVTDIPGAAPGDTVVLLGAQGDERIGADELAAMAGTISYETLLAISPRVPRVWLAG